jgi:hypothetical protein
LLGRRRAREASRISLGECRIHASIDQATSAILRGWAFDPTSKEPVIIELRTAGGTILKRGVANQPRPDVGKELGTHGMHGFVVPLPMRRAPNEAIDVFARSSSGEIRLTTLEGNGVDPLDLAANVEFLDTIIVVRPDSLAKIIGNETLVVCGPGRSGTSLIAYLLLRLGCNLGDDLRDLYHEDLEILEAIRRPTEMERVVAERNRRAKRWGFKVPYAVHYLDSLAGMLRNPVFVVTFRNPVAIAKTILRRDPTYSGAGLGNLGTALEYGIHRMELGSQVVTAKAPSVLIDVDAARGTPEQLVRDLASLFAPNTSDETIKAIASNIAAGGYKAV